MEVRDPEAKQLTIADMSPGQPLRTANPARQTIYMRVKPPTDQKKRPHLAHCVTLMTASQSHKPWDQLAIPVKGHFQVTDYGDGE